MMPLTPTAASGSWPAWRAASALAPPAASEEATLPGASREHSCGSARTPRPPPARGGAGSPRSWHERQRSRPGARPLARGSRHVWRRSEQILPGHDALVLRQPAEGVEPILQLIQGGISRWPDRRGRATIDGILIVALAAGILLGIELTIVHLGINLERATAPGGSTVDADSGNHCWVEGDALGESSPVHKALLEERGGSSHVGRAIGKCGAGARSGRGGGVPGRSSVKPRRRITGGGGLHLRSSEGPGLLTMPLEPLGLRDGDLAVRSRRKRRRGGRGLLRQARGHPPADLLAILHDPALRRRPERGVPGVRLMDAEPRGSITRVGTSQRRSPTPRAAKGSGSPNGGTQSPSSWERRGEFRAGAPEGGAIAAAARPPSL